jgi:hypothetical protein
MKACPKKWKAIPEETEVREENQEVPNEEATVQIIEALKEQSGDQQPVMGYRNPQKWQTKDNVV